METDELFGMGTDWRLNADVDNTHSYWLQNWNKYSTGYLKAGRALLEYIMINRSERDYLVYPLIFAFRHYLELRLKELTLRAGLLQGEPETIAKEHRLEHLWLRVRPRLERAFRKSDRAPLDRTECVLGNGSV